MKPQEIAERLKDTEAVLAQQARKLEDLESRNFKVPDVSVPDYSKDFQWIKNELLQSASNHESAELKRILLTLTQEIKKEQKPVCNRYSFSLFPESDSAFYPKILFGRFLPWMMLFVLVGGLYSLTEKGIEAWKIGQYNHQAERYVRAWVLLNENPSKRVKKAMDKAWVKSAEEK